VQFLALQKPCDLDLDLGSGRDHTDVHIWSRSTHTLNYVKIGKTFCGCTDGCMEGRTHPSSVSLLGQAAMTSKIDHVFAVASN